jgi:hypothetical protein
LGVTDEERLDFIKQRINYMFLKKIRQNGKQHRFTDDLIWLIGMAEKQIKKQRKKESRNGK